MRCRIYEVRSTCGCLPDFVDPETMVCSRHIQNRLRPPLQASTETAEQLQAPHTGGLVGCGRYPYTRARERLF